MRIESFYLRQEVAKGVYTLPGGTYATHHGYKMILFQSFNFLVPFLIPLDPMDFTFTICGLPQDVPTFPQNPLERMRKHSNSKFYPGFPIYQNEIISSAFENASHRL